MKGCLSKRPHNRATSGCTSVIIFLRNETGPDGCPFTSSRSQRTQEPNETTQMGMTSSLRQYRPTSAKCTSRRGIVITCHARKNT